MNDGRFAWFVLSLFTFLRRQVRHALTLPDWKLGKICSVTLLFIMTENFLF
jgi:hypothetical protein